MKTIYLIYLTLVITAVAQPATWRVEERKLRAREENLATMRQHIDARQDATEPQTITIGSLVFHRCLEDNSFGVHNFWCVNMTVPLDYDAPFYERRYMKVAFMLHIADPSRKLSKSVMFMPSGGPGTVLHTGMAAKYAYSFSDGMRLGNEMDLVFIDQRGMGWSCGIWCVNSYQWLTMQPYDPTNPSAYAAAMAQYKNKCYAEMRADPSQTTAPCIIGSSMTAADQRAVAIPYFSTKNAARDLESFRIATGYGSAWVYGRSYSTSVAQVYATLYPKTLKGIIIDSPIDISAPIYQQDIDLVYRRNAFLVHQLELCADDAVCAPDLARVRNAMVALSGCSCTYQDIVDKALGATDADSWPQVIRIPAFGADAGTFVEKRIFRWHLEYGVLNWEGSPSYSGDVARAILRAASGNRLTLLRMLWGGWGIDVRNDTVSVSSILEGSDEYSIYPIVYGNDYSYRFYSRPKGSLYTYGRAMQYLALGDAVSEQAMGTTVMMDCQGAIYNNPALPVSTAALINATVPSPGWHGNYKILIVGPSIDPFCADTDADRLYTRYMKTGPTSRIILNDGPHVSGGKTWIEGSDSGFTKVNAAIDNFVFGNGSASHITTIDMDVPLQYYISLTPPVVSSAKDAARWFDAEIVSLSEWRWYMTDAATCDLGGTVSWATAPNGMQDEFTLNNCQFFQGYVASGTGTYDWMSPNYYPYGADTTLDLRITDLSTGAVSCFDYSHVMGSEPTAVEKQC